MKTILSLAATFLLCACSTAASPPVTALAYRPDGKVLVVGTSGEVALIDPAAGKVIGGLDGQRNRVTALAFNKAGDRLAVASGEPSKSGLIRLYEFKDQTAKLLQELSAAHKDIIYALTFSPDGTLLASAGYDRIIKLWSPGAKTEPRVLQDHSDTIYALSFHPDGKLLASAAADRAVKVWDVAAGKRLYTLGDSTDWVYSAAWSPDGKYLAAAGIDKSIRIWEAEAEGGKLVHAVFAHLQPITRLIYSKDGKTLYSMSEGKSLKSWDTATMKEKLVFPTQTETMLSLALSPDQKQLAVGFFDGKLKLLDADTGKTLAEPLPAEPASKAPEKKNEPDRYPLVRESGARDSPRIGLKINLPATLVGALSKAGDADYVRFDLKEAQELSVQVLSGDSKLESVLELTDANGSVLAESNDGLLGFICPRTGAYALGIRDTDFRGGADFTYRISIGNFPLVTGVSPLSIEPDKEADVALLGVNLGTKKSFRFTPPNGSAPGTKVPLPLPAFKEKVVGSAQIVVGEFREVPSVRGTVAISVPGTATGTILPQFPEQYVEFSAKKGQRLIVEVEARRLGSLLDSTIDILDKQGQPVIRNTLRSVARTFQNLRDADSVQPGIRLESWNEFAVDDYLYANGELRRIKQMPKGPDDDCQFYQVAGQRQGFLDTTPVHHALGSPMYKVEIHPPGAKFPPNGLPQFDLPYRNDDGGPGFNKDSRLFFDPPADGEYRVRIHDARGQAGQHYGYRLTVREPRPSYTVAFSPTAPAVWKGGSIPITATATRIDGFDGPIDVKLSGLPHGFEAPPTTIEAGQTITAFPLFAESTAVAPTEKSPFKFTTDADIYVKWNNTKIDKGVPEPLVAVFQMRNSEQTSGPLSLLEPGDIVTTTNLQEQTIKPGQQAKLLVTVERRNGVAGRIPLSVLGLPHGVRVMNIGLNGILITERDTQREVVLYAEPWVKPMARPIIVLATREGKKTEHGARPVILKVAP